ncbi:MAG: MFS transporter [Actinomycetota bacterium]|nr:MFS transporter [Actinomycetota bacterium]
MAYRLTARSEPGCGLTSLDAGPRRPWAVFAVTCLGAFLVSLDLSIINIAFPAIRRTFAGSSQATLAWTITVYAITFGALLVPAGRFADLGGRRRVFFGGLAVFAAGSAACALAPNAELLVAGRALQGTGAAAVQPASLGLLLAAFPLERRARTVALWGGVGALAVVVGPTLGALLIAGAGWRWAFTLNLPLALLAWAAGRRVLPRTTAGPGRAVPDGVGIGLIVTSLALLALGISEGPAWGWASVPTLLVLLGALVLLPVFVRRCTHRPHPVLDVSMFGSRSFSAANLATLFYAAGFFASLLCNVVFLTSVWRYSIVSAGLAITPPALVVVVLSGPVGRAAGFIGFRPLLVAGGVSMAVALAVLATAIEAHPDYWGRWFPASVLLGIGIGLTFPMLAAASVADLGHDELAVGSAVNQSFRQFGAVIGVASLAALLPAAATLSDFDRTWWFCAGCALLSGATALAVPGSARGTR